MVLTKALLVAVLVVFLLTPTFIALFASAQPNLNKRIERADSTPVTTTIYVTETQFATSTCVFLTTTVVKA